MADDHLGRDAGPGPDGDLRRQLLLARDWGALHADVPGAARAVRTARVRRTTRLGLTAAAVAACVGAVAFGLPGTSALRETPPAGTTSVAPSPPVTPAPTAAPSASPTAGPSGSGPTAVATSPAAGLTHDVDLTAGYVSREETVVAAASVLTASPCPSQPVRGLDAATGSDVVTVRGAELDRTHAVLEFADAAAAARFAEGVAEQAAACFGEVSDAGWPQRSLAEPVGGPWGSGVALLTLSSPPDGVVAPTVGTWLLVGRLGAAVAIHSVGGEYFVDPGTTAIDADDLASVRAPFDALAAQLCPWTQAGCA